MNNITNQQVGKFQIQVITGSTDDLDNGVTVFLHHNSEVIYCENFDNVDLAKAYVKRNARKAPKVINGEVYNFN